MNFRLLLFLFTLAILNTQTKAQDTTPVKKNSLTYQTQFFKIKESANYGTVFNGLNFVFGYDHTKKDRLKILKYRADLAFGPGFGKGVGLNWHLKPGDIYYGWNLTKNDNYRLYLGPYVSANYQWQLYPELQSGHMFWFTFIDFGPRLQAEFQLWGKMVNVSFSGSVAGLVSRPVAATESHFYSLTFSDFLNNAHSDFKFGSTDLLSHLDFEIILLDLNKKRLSAGYGFQYFGYYDNPRLDYLTHGINLYWTLGKRNQI